METVNELAKRLSRPSTPNKSVDTLWNDWILWPPNAFGFLSVLLREAALARIVVSPPSGCKWPAGLESPAWVRKVAGLGQAWRERTNRLVQVAVEFKDSKPGDLPRYRDTVDAVAELSDFFQKVGSVLKRFAKNEFSELRHPKFVRTHWKDLTLLLEAHAVADEACGGLGIPGGTPYVWYAIWATDGLTKRHSLASLPVEVARVLPKTRVSQNGLSARSLTHHVACLSGPMNVTWSANPFPDGRAGHTDRLSLLLVPWPEVVRQKFVRPVDSSTDIDRDRFGVFRHEPASGFDIKRLRLLVQKARGKVDGTLGVVFPEGALSESEYNEAVAALRELDVSFIIAGIFEEGEDGCRNVARFEVLARQAKKNRLTVDYDKIHRWAMDPQQVRDFGLQWALSPHVVWWEDLKLRPPQLSFVGFNRWLSLCVVHASDLDQLEPIVPVIRSVGPVLVVALTADGPQLKDRSVGRSASLLARDPACSILSLTCLGLTRAHRADRETGDKRIIALWDEPAAEQRQLGLPDGAPALLLTLCPEFVVEYTADGRDDGGVAPRLTLVDHVPIHPANAALPADRDADV
ncbi:MAG: hypothetical protein AAF654_02725 [Myxococcota bacterium]